MKFLYGLLFCLLLLVACKPTQIEAPAVPQQKASHMIFYLSDTGRTVGECTGTAIGAHAIMTATHCDKDGDIGTINLDMSTRDYHIQKVLTDDRDHDIYLIDGPPLQNLATYSTRPAVVGEHVFMYGDGHGMFPPRRLDGEAVTWGDSSDVDAQQGEGAFTLQVIPGDSGSAVYADDGKIVGIVTWSVLEEKEHWWSEEKRFSVDFQPAFTDEQIMEAEDFTPLLIFRREHKSEKPKSLFDLFG